MHIHLQKRGINLQLIARSKDKLEEISKDLTKKYGIEVKTIPLDLTKKESFKFLKETLIPSLILVNNVGGAQDSTFKYFENYSPQEFSDMFDFNVYPTIFMTQICLQFMKEKKKGIILNMSSSASYVPYFLTHYASSKWQINTISKSLAYEYSSYGIITHNVMIGLVPTEATIHIYKDNYPWYSSNGDSFAEDTLNKIGFGGHELFPTFKNFLLFSFVCSLPEKLRFLLLYQECKSKLEKI